MTSNLSTHLVTPEQSYRNACKAVRAQIVKRHTDALVMMGKADWWAHMKDFRGFWGEDKFKQLILEIKDEYERRNQF